MKKIFIALIFLLALTGCSQPVLQAETVTQTVTVTETVIVEDTAKIQELESEVEQYKSLINNLNELLGNVYYGYAENDKYETDGAFTAFSLKYDNKYYLITAGHAAHYKFVNVDSGVYTSFKFKNNSTEWIYPKLLTYENDFINNRDYAILYSDKINNGLICDLNNTLPSFILGNNKLNTVKPFNQYKMIEGESGSPVIDIDGEVEGIATGQFVDIDIVLQAIDSLK